MAGSHNLVARTFHQLYRGFDSALAPSQDSWDSPTVSGKDREFGPKPAFCAAEGLDHLPDSKSGVPKGIERSSPLPSASKTPCFAA